MSDEIRLPSTGAPEPRRSLGDLYVHYCEHDGCREWGGWGYSRSKLSPTHWFCYAHREDGEVCGNVNKRQHLVVGQFEFRLSALASDTRSP
jgi:hypothetical protein